MGAAGVPREKKVSQAGMRPPAKPTREGVFPRRGACSCCRGLFQNFGDYPPIGWLWFINEGGGRKRPSPSFSIRSIRPYARSRRSSRRPDFCGIAFHKNRLARVDGFGVPGDRSDGVPTNVVDTGARAG